MLRINQLKLQVGHTENELYAKAAKVLRTKESFQIHIIRRSIDARKKPELFFSYLLDIESKKEKEIWKHCDKKQVSQIQKEDYQFPVIAYTGEERPIIIGMGPAGLFCAYELAKAGFHPILLERGKPVEQRSKDVESFWENGKLNSSSNVQFGEGGAGTFSDGKLNTLVKDKYGRNREVLSIFVKEGAPEEILYDFKPHIGTDVLKTVVKNMRDFILENGGEIHFETQVTDFVIQDDHICGVLTNTGETYSSSYVVLAIGHSARDTLEMLYEKKIPMEAKPFAVGFRVIHPQELINLSQYGVKEVKELGSAPYKLTHTAQNGRGVYSFCMCPGGYVVNASSEDQRLAVNGMSYSGRNGSCANSAIIISVNPKDYGSDHPLSGISFQRKLEKTAYSLCDGKIPVETYGDFKFEITGKKDHKKSRFPEQFEPGIKGQWCFGKVHQILPKELNQSFVEGMEHFGHVIPGFSDPQTLICGIESRTSSPVRIDRDDALESVLKGLFPCGEGAGYAGGITSAAMDGIKVAEEIARRIANGERKA